MDEDRQVERETVVVDTGGDRGGGSGGAIAAILVILVLGVLAFLFFGGYLQKAADETNINVNVGTPKIELPDIRIDNPPAAAPAPAPAPAAANQSGK
ncbi:MAG: hypothetical protein QOG13_3101 [Sphingomonadales bacterium]|jgi:hypothetical protein|nr:hypothetical protein [Sphingomonadales bacterium]MEA3044205.1 hypothetical protein [Sphingomonadales bacterium]